MSGHYGMVLRPVVSLALVAMAALVLISSGDGHRGLPSGAPRPRRQRFQPRCSMAERSRLFNDCLLMFGWAHFSDMAAFRASRSCLVKKLKCDAANTAVRCINGLPPRSLTDQCWDGLKDTLSYMLLDYNIGCVYEDIERQCNATLPPMISQSTSARRNRANKNGPQRRMWRPS